MGDLQASILVVEDDPDILRITVQILTAAGYRATPAYGGRDALRKVERGSFDLVVTDLAMPEMTGVELIDTLKRDPVTAGLPIIAVTAHWMDRLGDSASEVGCDGYVRKPFRREELLRVVTRVLSEARGPGTRRPGGS